MINLRYLFRRKRVKRMGCGRHNFVLQGFEAQTYLEQQKLFYVLFIARMEETEILIYRSRVLVVSDRMFLVIGQVRPRRFSAERFACACLQRFVSDIITSKGNKHSHNTTPPKVTRRGVVILHLRNFNMVNSMTYVT
jgi:hypothetical protein